MATRMYLANDPGPYSPTTKRGAWDATVSSVDRLLGNRRRGIGSQAQVGESSTTLNFDVLNVRFISDPIKAVTIAGPLEVTIPWRENDANANNVMHMHAYVTTGDSDTPRGTLLTDYIDVTEFVVSATLFDVIHISGISLSSVAASDGDRIVFELGYQAQNSVNTAFNASPKYGGLVSDQGTADTGVAQNASSCPWIEFSDTISPLYTYLYLTSDAAPVTPGAIQGTWDDTAAFDDYELGKTPSGARASRTKTETVTTNPYDMLAHRFVSPELAAQTINADIQFLAAQFESSSSADAFTKYHLYVMKPDGTVRGTLLSNIVGASELSGLSLAQKQAAQTPSSVAASDQDRLVLEVGARFTNAVSTSYNIQSKAGGANGEISDGMSLASDTNGSPWIQFRQELTWYTAPSTSGRYGQAVMVL